MIDINQYNKTFQKRHQFKYDDLNFLPKKYTHIKFCNIPEAWVYPLDKILSQMKDNTTIKLIQQIMGFISIDKKCEVSSEDNLKLQRLDQMLTSVDIDIFNQLETSSVLN